MSEVVNNLFERKIESFYQYIKSQCETKGINSTFKDYLFYKSTPGQYVPDSYTSLYRAPAEFLISSKAFKEYYKTLDADFKSDLITPEEYKQLFSHVSKQQSLQQVMKKYLKEDCVW